MQFCQLSKESDSMPLQLQLYKPNFLNAFCKIKKWCQSSISSTMAKMILFLQFCSEDKRCLSTFFFTSSSLTCLSLQYHTLTTTLPLLKTFWMVKSSETDANYFKKKKVRRRWHKSNILPLLANLFRGQDLLTHLNRQRSQSHLIKYQRNLSRLLLFFQILFDTRCELKASSCIFHLIVTSNMS